MQKILGGILEDRCIKVYIDDIIIASQTFESNAKKTAQVLSKLNDLCFAINIEKCQLM